MPGRGRPARLVAFLFGVAGQPELPGPALVALLADLGIAPGTGRTAIARLRANGNLAATRHGRTLHYRLDGDLASGFARIRAGATQPPQWSGHFHALIHQIPENRRAYRDQLRRTAVLSGFGLLGPGILISLRDRWADLARVLDLAPADAVLYRVRLELDEADAARAAAQAWNLATLDSRYAAHLDTLRAALASQHRPTGPAALAHYTELVSPVMVDTLRAPILPPALYPGQWSLPELRGALSEVGRAYHPAAAEHVAARLAATGRPG